MSKQELRELGMDYDRRVTTGCLSVILAPFAGRYVVFWIWGIWPGWPESLLFALIGPPVMAFWAVLAILHALAVTWPLVR